MSEGKNINLLKAAKELNIGLSTAADFLSKKGFAVEAKPMFKLEGAMYDALMKEFQGDKIVKEEAKQLAMDKIRKDEVAEPVQKPAPKRPDMFEQEEILIKNTGSFTQPEKPKEVIVKADESKGVKIVGKIDLDDLKPKAKAEEKAPVETPKIEKKAVEPVIETPATSSETSIDEVVRARAGRLSGPNVVGKIDLPQASKANPVASSNAAADQKRKRKRTAFTPGQPGGGAASANTNRPAPGSRPAPGGRPDFRNNRPNNTPSAPKGEPTEKEIQDQIKATLARLSGAGKSGKFAQRAKLRRQKRDDVALSAEEAAMEKELQSKVLKVTEFVTANELANMMDVPVTQIISTCMTLGLFVSINQRLDAETLSIVADEFGFEVEFVKPEDEENSTLEEIDTPEELKDRAPIVTVMGHVDHGKTSLLDFVRKTNVIAGEAGGITQHIGAYEVTLENERKITFLDTPGHEAFTAMRARGAKVTDIAIIVIAADDSVMPQTKEAINHAQAAGVPIVFAFSKVDKPGANADKIREQLSTMNILVEDWGGKYQSQEISGKTGLGIDALLEKVLLEADLLELKANANKRATGTVIEAALDKGRGIVTTVLIQAGTLKVGDPI